MEEKRRAANFGVVDMGTNVSAEAFINAAKESNADVIGLSALLTTTMPEMKSVVEKARAEGLDNVKIIIGGAPITQDYADEINADGYAPDAATAVDLVGELVAA